MPVAMICAMRSGGLFDAIDLIVVGLVGPKSGQRRRGRGHRRVAELRRRDQQAGRWWRRRNRRHHGRQGDRCGGRRDRGRVQRRARRARAQRMQGERGALTLALTLALGLAVLFHVLLHFRVPITGTVR